MKPLAALALLLLLVGTVAADEPPKKAPAAVEVLRQLQGTWQVESWEEGGKAIAADNLKKRGVFFGANVFILRRDDKPFRAGAIQFDPSKAPATMNFIVREGDKKGEVMPGIYSLDGDTLKLCFDPKGNATPKDFKSDAKDGFTLIVVKKPKPLANEAVDIVGKYRSELIDGKTGIKTVADVFIEKRGDGYTMTYKLEDKVLFVGTALRKGDQLSACWASGAQVGVSVYKIEAGPKLVGEFTILGGVGATGKETLTP
jgi:uncharacterized protein (TIGR03067 family)